MEVAESTEPVAVGAPPGVDTTIANGEQSLLLDDSIMDDDRSSSLSEIDDVSENIPSDYESPRPEPEKVAPENDSEAETERIEDSPNFRSKTNIIVSAAGYEPSPSKLAQSTTYDEVEDEEEHVADDSPSKPRARLTRITDVVDETSGPEDSTLSMEGAGKKRKRLESGAELGTEIDDDDLPSQKRRGSVKSDLSDPPPDFSALSPEPMEDPSKIIEEDTPADETPELTSHAAPTKLKRAKKGKRKGRKARDADEDLENGTGDLGVEADDNIGDDDTAERGDDVDDGEAAAKMEEESKRMAAMDSLAILEREFATLRDKIYDERISKLNRELEMLDGPNPTHPEFLRQLDCLARYRDSKIKYEHTLFQYRNEALLNKSLAERAQAHSTYFQRARDIREKHSSMISKQFYSIQHDRFKTDDVSPQHNIPFPTRRSQQIAHQTAYNHEISIMAGIAKYVGFPAAPALSAARPSELEQDLEKMGISIETKPPVIQQQTTLPRGTMPAMPLSVFRTSAEEAFLEQTPWANPQHPIHQHQQLSQRPQNRIHENPRAPAYTTPAAQKRVVDIHAPNGSASTIAENSSANNTPFDQEQAPSNLGHFVNPDYDADRRSGFRSLSSSPLDVRKPHPASYNAYDHRSPQGTSHHPVYSPPSARLGLFQSASSKREPSPTLSSRAVNSIHQSASILGGSGSNQMVAR
ncbi:uncharacterized protein BP01DRAFT_293382 [Aspergillus saccharolyticus JOP 1030-1]|uniref:Transcriptional regulatory protein Dep1 n=1 Tax=Aspergillus saccharolyticus JOP 1030-1 TaxID=1450539 RepID=A0A319A3E1_9EURO|nr:hypothetical protein BP01DRAFT_293382 [Aspergillus saccharolyticus JOP 1030-1]PYH46658.1 hypothetical protein BP01DRAFT_293382 [Aspergillus saccharolyticus JOP 1030-1]